MEFENNQWIEKQITADSYGHFLNPVQAWSPDGEWLVYDTRNEDPHISRTGSVERVNVRTGEEEIVYQNMRQTLYGPGVGAAAWSPVSDQIIFIRGLNNARRERPYGITRRTGVGVFLDNKNQIIKYDGRDVTKPFTQGALRGGTHAHSWNGDGQWISFTYNDAVMADLSKMDSSVQDLRMVGVMAPWGKVDVVHVERDENFSGRMFSMVISSVTESPEPGSDQISKAYEDGWIGQAGYTDSSGRRSPYAVAFLGDVRDEHGGKVTEVFVVDLPEQKPEMINEVQLKGSEYERPQPLSMVNQRRVTYTTDRKYPGVRGPRQWMKSSPDGSQLYFMMKDEEGYIQLFSVPTIGGAVRQISSNNFSIETAFDIDPSGNWAAYGSNQKVYLTSLTTGSTKCISDPHEDYSDLRAIQWSYSGHNLAFNRKVKNRDSSYYQIFTLSQNGE